ncbi:MAG: 6,7-dimethyl-8-ribityllumazine synthase [Verrucomicrobia bacterium]|jgi:6,7-dimethyl-8-ribityllumazine synthase|nr:MAG: 6,7-dimethyl-8-ribityllumazine synthase [Verrucomicrobiota bacterium]MDH4470381.1 6,7-dimethyl-8-ribityllumazine synthase [Verrucomicrobiae bacterium]
MSIHPPQASNTISQYPYRIAIVASNYNAPFVNALIEAAQKEILQRAPKTALNIIRVPGAFEIPLGVKIIAERHRPDAILALGVLIQGKTLHADLVANSITHQLLNLSLHHSIPIIHEVLLLENAVQATERCLGGLNRGAEAARAALSMLDIMEHLPNL